MNYIKIKDLKIGDYLYSDRDTTIQSIKINSIKKIDDEHYEINSDWKGKIETSKLVHRHYQTSIAFSDIRQAQTSLVNKMKTHQLNLHLTIIDKQKEFLDFCNLLSEKIKEREITIIEMSK